MNFESIQPFSIPADLQPEWSTINRRLVMHLQPHFPGPAPALCIGGRTGRRLQGEILDGVALGTVSRGGSKWGVTTHIANTAVTDGNNELNYYIDNQPIAPQVLQSSAICFTFRPDFASSTGKNIFRLKMNSTEEYRVQYQESSGALTWQHVTLGSPEVIDAISISPSRGELGEWISVALQMGFGRYMWTINHSVRIFRFSVPSLIWTKPGPDMEELRFSAGGFRKSNLSFSGDISTFFMINHEISRWDFMRWASAPLEWAKPFGHTALYPPVHCLIGEDKVYPASSGDSDVRRTTISNLGFGQSVSAKEDVDLPISSSIRGGASTSGTVDICER